MNRSHYLRQLCNLFECNNCKLPTPQLTMNFVLSGTAPAHRKFPHKTPLRSMSGFNSLDKRGIMA